MTVIAAGPPLRRKMLKRFLPRTLFGRSLVIILTPVLLVQAIAAFVFLDRHWGAVARRLSYALAGEIGGIVEQIGRDSSDAAMDALMESAARYLDLAISLDRGGTMRGRSIDWNPMVEDSLSRALADKVRLPFVISAYKPGEWVEIRVQLPEGVLRVLTPQRRLFTPTAYVFIAWMAGSALVLFAIAILFMRNQIRPIRRLAIAADSFGKGREVENFRPAGASEVRQAAQAFILMRDRLKRQLAQRTEMLAGVSHDLRTPLTRMKLGLAMLGDRPEVEDLKSDVMDMEQMVEAYLAFARGEGAEAAEPADLGELLNDVVSGARREGALIDLHVEGELTLPLRSNAVKRGITNLITNARRYGKHVWVRAGRRQSAVEVLVDDDGPGIPESDREEVFKPFLRLEGSRNQSTGGVGLGLTIARDVARSHGGDVVLSDSPQGGLRAAFRLPI